VLEFDPGELGLHQDEPSPPLLPDPHRPPPARVTRVNDKWFVLAHYSRHVRPGMVLLGTSDLDTVAAYDVNRRTLVLVVTNYGVARFKTFDLSRLATAEGPVTRWVTQASFFPTADPHSPFTRAPQPPAAAAAAAEAAADACCYVKRSGDVAVGRDSTLALWFGTNTTATVEVENVDL
jgi:hypothetical protein